jgi:ADP-ribose pyrophosphatase YjhB (NUDIX family)
MNNGPISQYPFRVAVPEGDNRERHVCGDCGWIHYVNPKIVVGAVCARDGRILLCRRAIEPRAGWWTIPAGYMEERETAEAGALREAQEEAGCAIALDGLLAVYSIPRISQVQIIWRARVLSEPAAGPESAEVAFFRWEEIPWSELAFPSVVWALRHWREVEGKSSFPAFANPEGEYGQRRPDGL